MNPEGWLAAARDGGMPEPARERWQPLRVGIVNLWEYDDAEFWFADGRLVLRGGNGTGKTKILELTTLMLLRGEIMPSVLDPFGSQHRTMRFNLLPTGEEDDPRPAADSGLGYAWAEFGRVRDGEPEYLVCGMGASARRGSGTETPRRWMFLTARRPGTDLVLCPAAGPRAEKDLRKQDGLRVFDNGGRYRAELGRDLFALEPAAYDNLTELLKQLRRPKLGERLNPKELENTLRDALPRLSAGEVTQLVEGWDRLEDLRRSIEQLEESAIAVAGFTRRHWRPWARAVVRRRADEVVAATTRLDNTTRDRREAEKELTAADERVGTTRTERDRSRGELIDRRTELRELINSSAYQDAVSATQRAESLRRAADGLAERATEAGATAETTAEELVRAERDHEKAQSAHDGADQSVTARANQVVLAAGEAGLAASQPRDVPTLRAAHGVRADRLARLEGLLGTWRKADAEVDKTAVVLQDREATVQGLRTGVGAAERQVLAATKTLTAQLGTWVGDLRAASCTDRQVAGWYDRIADLTEPGAGPMLGAALRAHLDDAGNRLREQRERLRAERRPLAQRHDDLDAELARVRAERETPPPPPALWARRDRSAAPGAPLWACVRPRDDDEAMLARLEATLAAAGLLDAWLAPDGTLVTDDDTFALAGALAGPNLLEVVEPTPAGGVDADRISQVLAGIGWYAERPTAGPDVWLAADGSWRTGPLTGRAEPAQPASYLGATARERARLRTIARLETELTETGVALGRVDTGLTAVGELLDRLAEEIATVPPELPVLSAVTRLGAVREQLEVAEGRFAAVREVHAGKVRERDDARARASSYAAEHDFPVDDLGRVRAALSAFLTAVDRLDGELRLLSLLSERLGAASSGHARALAADRAATVAHTEAQARARQAAIKAATARDALGADKQAQLRRSDELAQAVETLETKVERLSDEVGDLKVKATRAKQTLDDHESARAEAARRREAAIADWWAAADHGLVAPLGLALPDGRAVEATLKIAQLARRELTAADEAAQERAWRRCYEELQKLRQTLLPNRDAQVRQDDDDPLARIVVLADPASGWLPPDEADEALAEQVRRQRDRYDAEQQEVLTKLLGSTFIEHLKDRLDYTESVFTRINTVLSKHPTRQGHSLQLDWRADPADPDAGQVVEALKQGYEHLGDARQEMVRDFLKRRIDGAREEATAEGIADWRDHLATALDYRRWLRVQLQFRPGSTSRWRPFDAARHGSKSGGEKVVLLSQPLFAAAVVAYDAAGPCAPRMVWLDEAMTGVDNEVKATFMGLTVELDLDVMLTAHDEWCTYPSVPAVAIYDLDRQRHLPGVDALPYLWCGGELTELAGTLSAGPASPLEVEGGLFADGE